MMKRGKLQHSDDKLSDLPDCILVHILSFLNIKDAVRTGSLSRTWKHLWKRLQTLSFNDTLFKTGQDFTQFANQVLSLHDPSTTLIALDFKRVVLPAEPLILEIIETFGASRNQNLKRLSLSYCLIKRIPNFLFSCHSLESLTLESTLSDNVVFPDSLNLPALTYLKLCGLDFRSGDDGRVKPFSGFIKLNSLIIKRCRPKERDRQTLCISNAMLVDLVIDTIFCFLDIELSSPSLSTFTFNAYPDQKLSGNSLSCIKHASINGDHVYHASVIPTWLIELVNVETLTISSKILWVIFKISDSDLLKSKHTLWSNLKSLQVILDPDIEYLHLHRQILIMMRQRDVNDVAGGKPWKGNVKLQEAIKALKPYAFIPGGVIDYFIQNSPSANVDILIPKKPKGYYFL